MEFSFAFTLHQQMRNYCKNSNILWLALLRLQFNSVSSEYAFWVS